MSIPDFSRSKALNNIPQKKLLEHLSIIEKSNDNIKTKSLRSTAVNRYAESNIPVEYWSLEMKKDFKGDSRLLTKYNEYTSDLRASYINGSSICFAGAHGTGKSLTSTCILKRSCLSGFHVLYTTLSDVVVALTQSGNEDKLLARRELTMVDFLTIDEFDPRFFSSESASDLYARSLEGIFRTRSQNKLPTIMCTNSPNIKEIFTGSLKASIGSLISGYLPIFTVLGSDFR